MSQHQSFSVAPHIWERVADCCDDSLPLPQRFERIAETAWSERIADTVSGRCEHMLWDRTRVDVVTDSHVIEVEWPVKWAEAIGQSKWYATILQKRPAVCFLYGGVSDNRYLYRGTVVCAQLDIAVWLADINQEELRVSDRIVPLAPWRPD